jgi:AraC-like DNA-binding protein
MGVTHTQLHFARWLEPPQPAVTLMVSFAEPLQTQRGRLPQMWIAGLDDRPELVETGGRSELLDVKLTPVGAARVCAMPLRELSRRVVALDHVFGPDGRRLGEALGAATDWDARFALIDHFLLRRLDRAGRPSPFVAAAWQRLAQTAGTIRIGALARELRCSRRHLGVAFHRELGLAPKAAARVLRFAAVRARIADQPASWADIAHELGFADQSHLNREFRELAGTTPSDFVARLLPGGALNGDGIAFVQDGPARAA